MGAAGARNRGASLRLSLDHSTSTSEQTIEAGSWTERNRNLSEHEENAEGEARADLDTIDPDSYIKSTPFALRGRPMEKTSTPSSDSLQEKLERARLALKRVSPEARTRLLNEFLTKRKTRST